MNIKYFAKKLLKLFPKYQSEYQYNLKHYIVMIIVPLFIAVSCDDSIKAATYNVYNNSQFEVTEIVVNPITSIEKSVKYILEPGENCILIIEWVDGKTIATSISFYMNGEEFGITMKENITDSRRFKPGKRINNGDTLTVKIYDDHWDMNINYGL